jgi:hypothetical protein
MGLRSREETKSLEEQNRKELRVDGVTWMLSSTLSLSHHLRQYNHACEPPPWPENDPREIDQLLAICGFLNSLIEFRYNAYRFVDTDWGKEFPELVELVRPILEWSDGVAKDFITPSMESRIRKAMSVDEAFDVLEELTCQSEPGFRVRPHPNAGIDVGFYRDRHDGHYIDAFPELQLGVFDFEIIAETPLFTSLHKLISLNGELSAFLGDRDPTETSEAGTTDLRPTGAVQTVILSPLQQRILEVLECKALRKDALVDACGGGNLYKPSASGIRPLQELRDAGLVDWKRKIGFFRPDAAPPGVIRISTR